MAETTSKMEPLSEGKGMEGQDEPQMNIDDANLSVGDVVPEFLGLLLPMAAYGFLMYATETINVVLIGSTGDTYALAGVGLANMMQNCVAISVCVGLSMGMDTLVSQAVGAGDIEATGRHLMACKMVVLVYMFVAYTVLYFSESLLILLGQDPLVAQHAGSYNRASLCGLLFYVYVLVLRQYLQNCWDVMPTFIITFVATLLHPIWATFLVHRLENLGLGYANSVTWCLQASLYVVYIFRNSDSMGLSKWTLLGIERVGFQRCWSYLQAGVPAMVQLCSELWFWELASLLMGYVGEVELAAQTAIVSMLYLLITPAGTIAFAGATAVGTALGESRPTKAKKIVRLAVSLCLAYSCVTGAILLLSREALSMLYTPVAQIRAMMQSVLMFYAFAMNWETLQFVLGGLLRGMGYTTLCGVVSFVMYYVINLPVLVFLILQNADFFTMWVGMMSGSLWACCVYGYVLFQYDQTALQG
eukprot:CAMPEP_0115397182 /NCGR_PEP_ID=MMETSP0271-20121206/13674_1 /TAXON_ID=71861 /ORGANISM="Scrippsiella trochoidea, Strain CCMP3099" /LENGTH=472 /DNA_ID=CAMNT_0002820925 /DNA_START=35 /DNA_END=1453 /DNA_ORIENTATION=-